MNPRRKWMAVGMALPALAWMDALRAQANPPLVIGWLVPAQGGDGRGERAFHESMAALGWKVGTQYVVEARSAQGQLDRLPALAQEIAATKPAVIVVITSIAARAAAAAAPATPIVVAIGEPVSAGLVTNLARPGGMITGLSNVSADLNLKCIGSCDGGDRVMDPVAHSLLPPGAPCSLFRRAGQERLKAPVLRL